MWEEVSWLEYQAAFFVVCDLSTIPLTLPGRGKDSTLKQVHPSIPNLHPPPIYVHLSCPFDAV
jgi:hypothetical protein